MHKRKFVISITNAILVGKAFFTCQPQDAGNIFWKHTINAGLHLLLRKIIFLNTE
jgi:hypothetical protein